MIPESLLRETDALRALARGLLRDGAEDAVQEGFLAWLRQPPRTDERPRGWLAAVVRNVARQRLRGDRRREARERAAPTPPGPMTPDEHARRRETIEALVDALFSLTPPAREVLLLRYFEDLPPRAIARRLGVPVETVRTRQKRALAALRDRLDAHHDGDRRAWAAALGGALGAKTTTTAALGALAVGTTGRLLLTGAALAAVAIPVALHVTSGPDGAPAPVRATASEPPPVAESAPAPSATAPTERAPAATVETPPPAPSAWRVEGRVIDEEGRPIAGATVRFVADRGEEETTLATATSEADGSYDVDLAGAVAALADLPRRTSRLLARGAAPADRRGQTLLRDTLADHGRWIETDLVLHAPARRLRGRVVDAGGRPVEDAEVGLARPGAPVTAWLATTDASGRYALRVREAGTFTVRILAFDRGVGESGPLLLEPDRDHDAPDVVVEGPRSLSGRAVLPDGSPAADVRISAAPCGDPVLPDGRRLSRVLPDEAPEPVEDELARAAAASLPAWLVTDPNRTVARVTTGPDGAFAFHGLVPGEYRLETDAPRVDDDRDVAYATGTDGIRVVVEWYRLVVRLTGPDGTPVADPLLGLRRADGTVRSTRRRRGSRPSHGGMRQDDALVHRVVPGENVVSVTAPGLRPEERVYDVGPDDYETRDEIVLQRLGEAAGALELVLLDTAGERVDAFRATLATPRLTIYVPGCHLMAPDEDGLLRGLPAGRWKLSIHPGRALSDDETETGYHTVVVPVTVVAGETVRVEASVRPAAVVRLRVDFEGTDPPASLLYPTVTARRGALPPVRLHGFRTTYADGAATWTSLLVPGRTARPSNSRLEPGVWTFRLECDGFSPAETVAVLPPGEVTTVPLAVRRR